MTTRRRIRAIVGIAILLLGGIAETGFARTTYVGGIGFSFPRSSHSRYGRYGRGYGQANNPYMRMLAAQQSAQRAAMQRAAAQRAAVMAAQAEKRRAESVLSGVSSRLENQFNNSTEMIAATRTHDAAVLEYEHERSRVLGELKKTDAEYRNLVGRKNDLHQQVQAMRDSGNDSKEALLNVLRLKTEVGSQATKLEAEALNSDKAYPKTLGPLQEAAQHLNSLKQQFHGSVSKSSEWTQAREKVDQAQAKVTAVWTAGNSPAASTGRSSRPNNRGVRAGRSS